MSSVDDMLLCDKNFYENKLRKGMLLNEMRTRGVLSNGNETEHGLGLELAQRGLPTVGHEGALFGYRSGILRFPEQQFTVVCLCNLSSADPSTLVRARAERVYVNARDVNFEKVH